MYYKSNTTQLGNNSLILPGIQAKPIALKASILPKFYYGTNDNSHMMYYQLESATTTPTTQSTTPTTTTPTTHYSYHPLPLLLSLRNLKFLPMSNLQIALTNIVEKHSNHARTQIWFQVGV